MASVILFSNSESAAVDAPTWVEHQPKIGFGHLALSPDGETLAFDYIDRSLGRNYLGVGLYNWKSGKLTRIPSPSGKQLSSPSFSHDGKRMLVAVGYKDGLFTTEIAEVETSSLQLKYIGSFDDKGKMYPVYQPATEDILYVHGRPMSENSLRLFNRSTGKERVILHEGEGFLFIMKPFFIASDEVVFQARSPTNIQLRREARSLIRSSSKPITYHYTFGRLPEFFDAAAEKEASAVYTNEGAFSGISFSRGGKMAVYVRSPAVNPVGSDGLIIRELFKIENGLTEQLTNSSKGAMLPSLSYNGKYIAFVQNLSLQGAEEVFIYDTNNRSLAATGLLSKIENDEKFSLQ